MSATKGRMHVCENRYGSVMSSQVKQRPQKLQKEKNKEKEMESKLKKQML